MMRISYPILVEGKYDQIKLRSLVSARVIATEGFAIFQNSEKAAYLRKLAEKSPLIVLTDSDGAGLLIRNHLNAILPKERLIHLYIPEVMGKERRKSAPSKEGFLGVEGMEAELLRDLLAPYADDGEGDAAYPADPITKQDLYAWGLSGGKESAKKRRKLAKALALPQNLSANALLDALSMLFTREECKAALKTVSSDPN